MHINHVHLQRFRYRNYDIHMRFEFISGEFATIPIHEYGGRNRWQLELGA